MGKFNTYASFATSLLKNKLIGKKVPMIVTLAVTGRCNYSCSYCYADYPHRKDLDFSTQQITDWISEMSAMGTKNVNLIGGEPLLRDDIGAIVGAVKSKGMSCHISTNASLIPLKINEIKEADAILTSLDGKEESNDLNRGKGTFKKTMDGIDCALKNGLTVHVNSVITKNNIQDIDYMVELAKSKGFSMSFNVAYESHSDDFVNYQNTRALKPEDDTRVRGGIKKIIEYRKKGYPIKFSSYAYRYTLNYPVPFTERVYLSNDELPDGFNPIKCHYPSFNCYIDSDGRMYNCFHMRDKTPVINVKDLGFKDAWAKLNRVKIDCRACYTICNNNTNAMFSLNPSALFENVIDMLRR